MGLIAFDLKQIITPLFHNGPGVLTLAVQGIAGDDLPIQCRQGYVDSGGIWRNDQLCVGDLVSTCKD
jgi:hypothetical protein